MSIPAGVISERKIAEPCFFEKNDLVVEERQKPSFLVAEGILEEATVAWERMPGDRGGRARDLIQKAGQAFDRMRIGEDNNLPILAYYGAGRLWDKHRKVPLGKPESRGAGYRNCLDPKSDHFLFEKWFKQQETVAIQRRKQIGALEMIRKVVTACIPGADDFFFETAYDQLMIVLNDKGHQRFDRLSDGYRNMIAIVADIAHRAVRLNPHLGEHAAELVEGIVLIDEIDQHLHPHWQRRVMGDLKKVFPKIQFIVSTHSPFIIQSLEPGEVLDLGNVSEVVQEASYAHMATPGPGNEFSNRSLEDIVEMVMGVPIPSRSLRYQEMYDTAKAYFRLLKQGKEADEQTKQKLKQDLDRLSAPFSDDMAFHAFLEMKREVAGLGSNDGDA